MTFSEMLGEVGDIRDCYAVVQQWVDETGIEGLHRRLGEAEAIFRRSVVRVASHACKCHVGRHPLQV